MQCRVFTLFSNALKVSCSRKFLRDQIFMKSFKTGFLFIVTYIATLRYNICSRRITTFMITFCNAGLKFENFIPPIFPPIWYALTHKQKQLQEIVLVGKNTAVYSLLSTLEPM